MQRMPDQIREQVAEKVLARAVAAKWDDLNANERSRLYRVWSEDPEIGGVIARFIPRDGVRVWIKDGPMKEYTRARRGLGPFAGSIPVTTESEERITARLAAQLTQQWSEGRAARQAVQPVIDTGPSNFTKAKVVLRTLAFDSVLSPAAVAATRAAAAARGH